MNVCACTFYVSTGYILLHLTVCVYNLVSKYNHTLILRPKELRSSYIQAKVNYAFVKAMSKFTKYIIFNNTLQLHVHITYCNNPRSFQHFTTTTTYIVQIRGTTLCDSQSKLLENSL